MNQPVPEELISAYFDGEVTPEQRGEVERLLESSSDLRQQLDDTSKLSALLHSFPREAAPEEIAAKVEQRISKAVQVSQRQAIPAAGVQALACPDSAEFATSTNSIVTPASVATTRRSLRREWVAFGTGMMATMASLLLFVTWNRSQNVFEREEARISHEFPAERIVTEPKVALNVPKAAAAPARRNDVTNHPVDGLASDTSKFGTNAENKPSKIAMSVASAASDQLANSSDAVHLGEVTVESENVNGNPASVQLSQSFFAEQGDFQPLSLNELLDSVKDGKVIRKNSLDPSNNVVVVEFTVVDIDRFVNEMKILLQKRLVPQVSDSEAVAIKSLLDSPTAAGEKDGKNVQKLKKSAASDGLFVIYVRAPGEQLSETLSESINLNPQNYLGLVPQLPIELRWDELGDHAESAEEHGNSTKLADVSQDPSGNWSAQPVAVEAKLAVNNYAGVNGLAFGRGGNPSDASKHDGLARGDAARGNSEEVSAAMVTSDNRQRFSAPEQGLGRDRAESPATESRTGLPGYATFHLSHDDQHQSVQQKANVAGRNSAFANQTQLPQQSNNQFALNYPFSVNSPSSILNNSSGQKRPLRSSTDNRMVRMLIVLKPDQANATTSP